MNVDLRETGMSGKEPGCMEAEVGGQCECRPEGDGNVREGAGLYGSGGGWTV